MLSFCTVSINSTPEHILFVHTTLSSSVYDKIITLSFGNHWLPVFNPIQDGLFRGCSRMGRGSKKAPPSLKFITHILQWWNLAQLYLTQRRSKKYMNHVTHPLSSADISIFHRKSANFAISRNADIDCILIHNFYLF